jgi:hypothetical protein
MILLNNLLFATESIIEVIPLYNRPATEIQPLLTPMLDSTDRVIADGSNLIVRTTPDRLNLKKSVEFNPTENIQHKLDRLTGGMSGYFP